MSRIFELVTGTSLFIMIILISGCGNNDDIMYPKEPEINGIAAPVELQTDSTFIVLQDYFHHPKAIDSIQTDESLKYIISGDSTTLTIIAAGKTIPKLSELKVWVDGFPYSIILEKSPKIWQHITFDPKEKKYNKIQIAGDMNDWNPARNYLKLKDKLWETDLLLFPGKYQYKLVVDGKYILDPGNSESMDNNVGSYNSVMHVGSVNPLGAPYLFTDKIEKNKITIGSKNKTKKFFVLWQNYRLDEKFVKTDSAGLQITIPKKAKDIERSFIRVWAFNPAGISNSILVPLSNGKVITEVSNLSRSDKQAMIIYFLMVDRFRNGDTKNDAPLKDKDVDKKVNFQGGDLAGIQQKINDLRDVTSMSRLRCRYAADLAFL